MLTIIGVFNRSINPTVGNSIVVDLNSCCEDMQDLFDVETVRSVEEQLLKSNPPLNDNDISLNIFAEGLVEVANRNTILERTFFMKDLEKIVFTLNAFIYKPSVGFAGCNEEVIRKC